MQKVKTSSRIISVAVALILLASPILAQRRPAAPKKPVPVPVPEVAPTFDTLLAEETYRIYGEIRNVGQVARSPAVNDLLQPLIKIVGAPKEFKTIIKWINSHGEALASSRMFVASWPVKPAFPQLLMAVEFPTPDEARKFESELRRFVPTLTATPTPSPAASPDPVASVPSTPTATPVEVTPPAPAYQIKQTGSLVLLSDKPISFRTLKPRRSRLLAEDPNFALARNRFASEAIFLYVDVKSIEKEQREQTRKWEEEEEKRREKEAANPPKPDVTSGDEDSIAGMPPRPPDELAVVNVTPETAGTPEPTVSVEANQGAVTATLSSGPQSNVGDWGMISLYGALFGGAPKWPEAVGAAVAFEDDGYAVRALVLNGPDNKSNAIPFVPQFISGPALTPASPAIMPADVDLFVTLSLDYPQIYEGMLKAISGAEELSRKYSRQTVADKPPTSPFAEYEKKLGLKIKDDLLPLLGNEIALALPKKGTKTNQPETSSEQPADGNNEVKLVAELSFNPVIAISIKDREAVKRVIPKIIEGFAFKGASLLAQTEKRDDTEIVSFANVLSYGFIGDFMIVSTDPAVIRHVVDSYLNHQTLSSDSHFRNSTRWQAQQVQGQVYVAPSFIDLHYPLGKDTPNAINEELREMLGGMSPAIESLTYSLTNEGSGPLHELHMPKGLLMLMIAGMSAQSSESPIITNESIAQSLLRTIASGEASFRAGKGDGRYGSIDELVSEELISKDLVDKYGYKIELTVLANKFEVTAVPLEYGKTGRRSFFVDESGVLRAGDHGGGTATLSDRPVE
ncbi:MAG: DUF3352 domain-containing protein [Acidobacteriota bacterium]|nr:DUF3352 domain-containing protein [Acidobacteriota bacterium]